jgi:hypothetical protein
MREASTSSADAAQSQFEEKGVTLNDCGREVESREKRSLTEAHPVTMPIKVGPGHGCMEFMWRG